MADVQDVLIVGGGAAGYTAGIFTARDRRRALLLEKFSSGARSTFVDSPLAQVAEAKLLAITRAAEVLRRG